MNVRTIDIKSIKLNFEHEIKYFTEYIQFNIQEQVRRAIEINNFLELDIKEGKSDEDTLRNVYQDDFIKLPSYFCKSTIVMIYSLLESTLMEICDKVRSDLEFQFSVNDFANRDNLSKVCIFLEKLIDVRINRDQKGWNRREDFRHLRNIIVHQNARFIKEIPEKDLFFLKRLKGIQLNRIELKFYIMDPNLIFSFLELIGTFLQDIFDQIDCKEVKLMEVSLKSSTVINDDFPF